MKRILYVTDNNVDTIGGEQESTKILVGNVSTEYEVGLAQPGAKTCSTPTIPNAIFSLGDSDRVKKLFKNPFRIPAYLFRLKRTLAEWRPDIVHSQSQVAFFALGLLRRLKLVDAKIIFIHTDRSIFSKYNKFFRGLFRFCLPAFDTLVLTTDLNKQLWADYFSGTNIQTPLRVIYNTPGELFISDSNQVESKSYLTIGFAGRYCDWKNWPLAEEIITSLHVTSKDEFRYSMAVGCLDEASESATKAMFNRMESLVGERFTGGINIPFNEMANFYQQLDILVVTSNPGTESFGRTVVEAMAKGCAVLTTNCGGPTEIIRNKDLMLESAEGFKQKIEFLNKDRDELERVVETNKKIVEQHYSFEANVERHLELYNELQIEA